MTPDEFNAALDCWLSHGPTGGGPDPDCDYCPEDDERREVRP